MGVRPSSAMRGSGPCCVCSIRAGSAISALPDTTGFTIAPGTICGGSAGAGTFENGAADAGDTGAPDCASERMTALQRRPDSCRRGKRNEPDVSPLRTPQCAIQASRPDRHRWRGPGTHRAEQQKQKRTRQNRPARGDVVPAALRSNRRPPCCSRPWRYIAQFMVTTALIRAALRSIGLVNSRGRAAQRNRL
jgi:hypothetical protein